MQVVIDIPEIEYNSIVNYVKGKHIVEAVYSHIANGKVLPKGYGQLITRDSALDAVTMRHRELSNDPQYVRKRGDIDLLGVKGNILMAPTILDEEESNG